MPAALSLEQESPILHVSIPSLNGALHPPTDVPDFVPPSKAGPGKAAVCLYVLP